MEIDSCKGLDEVDIVDESFYLARVAFIMACNVSQEKVRPYESVRRARRQMRICKLSRLLGS